MFGAGAIGGHIAARLHAGGAETSVLARGAHLAAMQANGLQVHTSGGTLLAPVHAVADPAGLGPQDHVIVAVKAPALPGVAAAIGPLLGPRTAVTFAMNGIPWWYFDAGAGDGRTLPTLDPAEAMRRALGPGRTIGCVVHSSCTVVAPGVVEVESVNSRLVLGEADDASTDRLHALAGVLRQGGIAIEEAPRIRDAIWAKLLANLGSGPLCVLAGQAARDVFDDAACCTALRHVVAEGAAIAHAMGAAVTPNAEAQLRHARQSSHKPSILQDYELGRPMEIEAIYRLPLMFARERGVPTPTLDLLVALVERRAAAAGLFSPPARPAAMARTCATAS